MTRKETKWERRDRKRKKAKDGMRESGRSVRLLWQIIRDKAERAKRPTRSKKERRKDKKR